MARGTNSVKLKEWKDRLARLEPANQTVAEYCLDEHLSEGSCYRPNSQLRPVAPPRLSGPTTVLVDAYTIHWGNREVYLLVIQASVISGSR